MYIRPFEKVIFLPETSVKYKEAFNKMHLRMFKEISNPCTNPKITQNIYNPSQAPDKQATLSAQTQPLLSTKVAPLHSMNVFLFLTQALFPHQHQKIYLFDLHRKIPRWTPLTRGGTLFQTLSWTRRRRGRNHHHSFSLPLTATRPGCASESQRCPRETGRKRVTGVDFFSLRSAKLVNFKTHFFIANNAKNLPKNVTIGSAHRSAHFGDIFVPNLFTVALFSARNLWEGNFPSFASQKRRSCQTASPIEDEWCEWNERAGCGTPKWRRPQLGCGWERTREENE